MLLSHAVLTFTCNQHDQTRRAWHLQKRKLAISLNFALNAAVKAYVKDQAVLAVLNPFD